MGEASSFSEEHDVHVTYCEWWSYLSFAYEKGTEGKMRRTILLAAAVCVALLMAVSSVLLSGTGWDDDPVAQAQTSSEAQDDAARQVDSSQAKGAAGRADGRGVSMRPETSGSQAQPRVQRASEVPPLGLTDRGKAALEQARRGEAQPAERPVIDVEAPSTDPSANGPEGGEPQPDTPALGTSFLGMADTGWFPPDHQI